jgi:hypothetical protein
MNPLPSFIVFGRSGEGMRSGLRVVGDGIGLLHFDGFVETKCERLLEPRRTEIRFCRGAKLASLSRTAQPKTDEDLSLAQMPAQTPNCEAGCRRAQIGIEVERHTSRTPLAERLETRPAGSAPAGPTFTISAPC